MEEFDLFKKTLEEYYTNNNISENICSHNDVKDENGAVLCLECGEEIKRELNFDKEWRYYGCDDTRRNTDPNRCQIRKNEDKSIFKDVENMNFCEKIINMANDIYGRVTKGKIYRGNSRKSIVFACIFHSYKISGKPQTCDKLQEIFKLEKKIILKGLKFVSLNVPKDSQFATTHITPIKLIEEIISKFEILENDRSEIDKIYYRVYNKSSLLNRSRPQSFAAGLIYYWILENKKNINIKEFIKKVNLSELTISKISKEIQRIIK